MSSTLSTYEIRLREEYNDLVKLKNNKEVNQYIDIHYIDRISSKRLPINTAPSSKLLYPEVYYVTYSIPLYEAKGRLNKDWKGILEIKVSKSVLLNPGTDTPPEYDLDIKSTNSGTPFNQHISTSWVCIGGVWSVAKEFGIWYFIIGIGGLLNQESVWMADDGTGHLNPAAYSYWKNERSKKPINNINWPYTLNEGLVISNKPKHTKPKFKIKNKEEIPIKKFTIGSSSKSSKSFKIKKAN